MTSTVTYEGFPLSASETSTERAYGIHPIPVCTDTAALELPQLIGQKSDEVSTGDRWKKWGRWKRDEQVISWHFYAADTKFEIILREPFKVVDTGAAFSVSASITISLVKVK